MKPDDQETFIAIQDLDEWESFCANNEAALSEIGDKSICFALACNCSLVIGGGASPQFRIGFVD